MQLEEKQKKWYCTFRKKDNNRFFRLQKPEKRKPTDIEHEKNGRRSDFR